MDRIKSQCSHGSWLMWDSCPGCDAEEGTPHAPDLVPVTGRRGRAVKRCRQCGGVASAPQHVTRRKPVVRRAKNTNRQGANFELAILADLKAHGYDALRSSGSRGAVDVVAFGDGEVVLVQAKISAPVIPPAERRAVLSLALRAMALPLVAWRDKGTIRYRELTGPGPKEWAHWTPTTYERTENDG